MSRNNNLPVLSLGVKSPVFPRAPLHICHRHEKSSFQVAPAPSAGTPEWIYIGQSCLSQCMELQWETKSSLKAQTWSPEPHPAHTGLSNNEWLLPKDPDFWAGLLRSDSEWMHFTSGDLPLTGSRMTSALWLNYMTCFAQMLAMAFCEHCLGQCCSNWVCVGRGKDWCQFLPSVFCATFNSLPAGAAAPFGQTIWYPGHEPKQYHTCEEPQLLFVARLAILGSVTMHGGGIDFYTQSVAFQDS